VEGAGSCRYLGNYLTPVRGDDNNRLGWCSNLLQAGVPAWLIDGVVHGGVPMVMAIVFGPSREKGTPALIPHCSRLWT
jgi:hypothetical protein